MRAGSLPSPKLRGLGVAGLMPALLALLFASLPSSGREPRLLSQYYLVNDPSAFESLQRNYAKISLVSPQWLSVNEAGELESTLDSAVVEWAAGKRVALMPLVVNQKFQPSVAHAVLNDDAIQSRVIQRIVDLAVANHFLGIQFDFENIPEADRNNYTAFIGKVAKEFHQHKLKLSVAVVPPLAPAPAADPASAPPSSGWITNPHSFAYDYQNLAAQAYFISLMAYDEYASPGQPGPIAGQPWVEACIRKTLELVSPKKLLLGIPLYYRGWSGKTIDEGSIHDAQELATKWNTKIVLDPAQRESFFKFIDGDQKHDVWLHDVQSLRESMNLVNQYHLAGISAWRLGFEEPAAWDKTLPEAIKKIH